MRQYQSQRHEAIYLALHAARPLDSFSEPCWGQHWHATLPGHDPTPHVPLQPIQPATPFRGQT